jgi:type IV pilus assembly protein PilV
MKINKYVNLNDGFSLIEVLVTFVIVGVALLGMTVTQLQSMRNANQALEGTIASIYIAEMAERIRANNVQSGNYVIAHGVLPAKIVCDSVQCTSEQIRGYDIYSWQTAIKDFLPSGGGQIEQDGSEIKISVRWDQDLSGSSGENCPMLTSADLDCIQLIVRI